MLPCALVKFVVRGIDCLSRAQPGDMAAHLLLGRQGEDDAYFFFRKRGYRMVARNFRTPVHRGEIDLIGWKDDVLCFIEVKTRTSRDFMPAEAAVDRDKQRELTRVAWDYLRHLPATPQWRFDIVSVYYGDIPRQPHFEVFENAFST